MMSFVSLLLVGILFHATQAEQLTKCEVFHKLKDLKDYGGVSLPECEFTAILLCPIIHLLHSLPQSLHPLFSPLLLIWLLNSSLISLLFYYIYLSISPFSHCLILWNSFHLIKRYSVVCHICRLVGEPFSVWEYRSSFMLYMNIRVKSVFHLSFRGLYRISYQWLWHTSHSTKQWQHRIWTLPDQ